MAADIEEFEDQYHRTVEALIQGDPEPQKELWSRADDATLANPLGPPAKGWSEISRVMDHASLLLRDGEVLSVDRISSYSTVDVAWTVQVEHSRVKVGGAEEHSPVSLRVTTIFRREGGDWHVAHRHADPVTAARPPESLTQDSG